MSQNVFSVSSVRTAVEKVEEIDVNEHMYALETLSIESEPDDHNFDEKCDSYEEWSEDEEEEDLRNEFLPFTEKSTIVKKFTQAELNDLVRDLGLPKDGAEYLASTLKRRNMLESGTNASYYRTRNESFKQYFEEKKFDDEKLVHCNNVEDLMKEIKCNIYKTDEWRLFIDSSKRSLKAVLLHNTNKFASIPIAHSTTTKETYGKGLIEKIRVRMPKVGCMREAYNEAAQIELEINNQRDRREGGQMCALCGKTSHKITECDFLLAIKAKTSESTTNDEGCSGCGDRAHTISNCKDMYMSNQTCSHCNKGGHVAATCNAQIAKDTDEPELIEIAAMGHPMNLIYQICSMRGHTARNCQFLNN
ncbi:hypothetical protein TKK_0014580 [Trichogramma kaykai]